MHELFIVWGEQKVQNCAFVLHNILVLVFWFYLCNKSTVPCDDLDHDGPWAHILGSMGLRLANLQALSNIAPDSIG